MNTIATNPVTDTESRQRDARRIAFVQWIRKTHGWFGLWGAVLGLTFGTSGIWLNHRAVLKLPPVAQQRSSSQIALPDPVPASAEAMQSWLQGALGVTGSPGAMRVETARAVPWAEIAEGGKRGKRRSDAAMPVAPDAPAAASVDASPATAPLMQPEHWTFNFGGPDVVIQADYWKGNKSVSVRTTSNGFIATLMNFHKGVGMTTAWILLVDTLAGSLIFLSLTGVILWVQTNRRRMVGTAILFTSLAVVLGLAAVSIWA